MGICKYYERNTCGHQEHYGLAEGKCEGGMFCPGYSAPAEPMSEVEEICDAQGQIARLVRKYALPLNDEPSEDIADQILALIPSPDSVRADERRKIGEWIDESFTYPITLEQYQSFIQELSEAVLLLKSGQPIEESK